MQILDATSPPTPRNAASDLEGLFRDYSRLVFRAAYRVTGNATDAEDVLQTIFLRLARRGEEAEIGEAAASYFHRAAVNCALDVVRRRTRSDGAALDEVASEIPDEPSREPDQQQGRREIRSLVRNALGALNPKAAEIFALRYFEGYRNTEIARMLGTSRTTIAVTLHRAKKSLKKELDPFLGRKS